MTFGAVFSLVSVRGRSLKVVLDVDGAQRLAAGLRRLHHRHFGLLSRLLLVTKTKCVENR